MGPGKSLDIGEESENFFLKNDCIASLVQAYDFLVVASFKTKQKTYNLIPRMHMGS